jgi:hypothetical protein
MSTRRTEYKTQVGWQVFIIYSLYILTVFGPKSVSGMWRSKFSGPGHPSLPIDLSSARGPSLPRSVFHTFFGIYISGADRIATFVPSETRCNHGKDCRYIAVLTRSFPSQSFISTSMIQVLLLSYFYPPSVLLLSHMPSSNSLR